MQKEFEKQKLKRDQEEAKLRELDEKRLARERLQKEKEEAEQRRKEEALQKSLASKV